MPLTAKRQTAVTNKRVGGFEFGYLEFDLPLANLAPVMDDTLTITTGTQQGFFKTGDDVGELNAHDYKPGEFVTNDFIYEGLTEWDGAHTEGMDGIAGTDDDFVKPSLATSWTTNYDALVAGTATRYEITFTLRSGVTFHDGAPWNAAACGRPDAAVRLAVTKEHLQEYVGRTRGADRLHFAQRGDLGPHLDCMCNCSAPRFPRAFPSPHWAQVTER